MRLALFGLAIAGAVTGVGGSAHADDNKLTILQSGIGNELALDQTQATGSEVRGLELGDLNGAGLQITPAEAAQQLGGNNAADVTVTGTGDVYLYQNNTAGGYPSEASRNTVTIRAENGGTGLVAQNGSGNTATLTVGALSSAAALTVGGQAIDGAIIQNGNGNRGTVVTGLNTSGLLVQNGNGNQTVLDVSGSAAGTSVVYTQNGNNLNSATAAQVYTNALNGTVSVTQTSFGSVSTQGTVTVTQTAR
ncbi:hypothetical protein [Mangrovicella endophytica]|uniref:hypothetical protein n=1 Tax=Mangrovicella endophytica TaxID=2066697 RepID=UPI000C9E90D3|nr:hypothetical protein [Mangrovicella endophytica]